MFTLLYCIEIITPTNLSQALLVHTYLKEVVHHSVVEVLPAQMRVTRRGLHLEDPFLDRQHRYIERSTTKIEDEHVSLFTLLVEAVSDGSGRGLVDDPHDVQTGN